MFFSCRLDGPKLVAETFAKLYSGKYKNKPSVFFII